MGGWLWELSVTGTRGQGQLGLITHRCKAWWSLAFHLPGAPLWLLPAEVPGPAPGEGGTSVSCLSVA